MALRFTLRQLEYFIAVGETGSIARASEHVHVSPPSISTAISQLEDELGLPLFVRKHAHGLSLTQAGHQLIRQAKNVLAEADGLNRLTGDISGNVQGELNIGGMISLAQILLPSLRRAFEEKYPLTKTRQVEADQFSLVEKIHRAEIDIALTYDLDIPTDIEFISLRSLPPYAILSENHPLSQHSEIDIEELLDYPMILLDLPHSNDYFRSFFRSYERKPNIAERTRDMAVLRSLVANDFGYSIINLRPLSDISPDGRRLRFVPLKGKPRPMRLGLIASQGSRNVLTIRAFIDHTVDYLVEWDHLGLKI